MGKDYPAKSFKSGNSVAMRMPVALGIEPDREWRVHKEDDGRIVIVPKAPAAQKIDLTGIWGSCPGLKPLTTEDRVIDARELDWEGKLLARG
jgi:antitoxin VapB